MAEASERPERKSGWVRRWFLRGLLAVAILVVLGIVALLVWGWREGRLLEAQIAAYRAAGEPVLPEDFNPAGPGPEDDQNAALLLNEAASLVPNDGEVWKGVDLLEGLLPLRPEEAEGIRAVLAESEMPLDLVRRATTRPSIDWQIRLKSPVLDDMFPSMKGLRDLSLLLQAAALEAHERGDDEEAVKRVRQGLFLARALEERYGLVAHLVALGTADRMAATVAQLAPDLRVGDEGGGGATTRPARPATPEQVAGLIADLMEQRSWHDGGVRAIRGERLFQLDSVLSILKGVMPTSSSSSPSPVRGAAGMSVLAQVLRGMFLRDARIMMTYTTGVLPALERADWPAARAAVPPYPREVEDRHQLHIMASLFLTELDRLVFSHYRVFTARRTAAVAVAVGWYAAEHGGRRPAALGELVPRYLPAVPADPMGAGSPPLRYRVDGDAPVVYSVGEDGADDGGSEQLIRGGKNGPQSQDIVVHLTRQPRPAPEPDLDN